MFYRRARRILDLLDRKWRTAKEIALELRCSVKTARKTLDFLVEKGLAEVTRIRTPGNWAKAYRRADGL
jgi:predicted ArsR family transcriptional regulator